MTPQSCSFLHSFTLLPFHSCAAQETYRADLTSNKAEAAIPKCRQPKCHAAFSVQDLLCGLRSAEGLLDLSQGVLADAVGAAVKKVRPHTWPYLYRRLTL